MLPDSSTAKRYGAFTAAIGLTLLCAASLSSTPPTDADNLLLDAATAGNFGGALMTSGSFTMMHGTGFHEKSVPAAANLHETTNTFGWQSAKWCNNDKKMVPGMKSGRYGGREQCLAQCRGNAACKWIGYRVGDKYCEFWGSGSCQNPHYQPGHDISQVA